MADNVLIAVIAACGVVISAFCVLGRAIFAFTGCNERIDGIKTELKEFHAEFVAFKDVVNGKFSALDVEIGKLLDRSK